MKYGIRGLGTPEDLVFFLGELEKHEEGGK
jgi:hypothetical protein